LKPRLIKWAGRLGVVLSLALMIGILWSSAGQLQSLDWKKFLAPSLIGLGIYGISLILQGWLWVVLVSNMTGVPWGWWDVRVYTTTHFMRRIPGAPWYMAGRALAYREQGRSGGAALTASLVEWGGILIAAGVLLSIFQWGVIGLLATLFIVGLGLTLWPLARKLKALPQRLRPFFELRRRWVLAVLLIYLFVWLLGGLMLYLLIASAQPESNLDFIQVVSLWALGGGLSLLTVIVPAGLGVREISITILLQPYLGAALALVIALLMRVLFTVGDFFWGGILWLTSTGFLSKE
jgi:glycosyltransferase 2 family protein